MINITLNMIMHFRRGREGALFYWNLFEIPFVGGKVWPVQLELAR